MLDRRGGTAGAQGGGEQHPLRGEVGGHVDQQREARVVGPLNVLENGAAAGRRPPWRRYSAPRRNGRARRRARRHRRVWWRATARRACRRPPGAAPQGTARTGPARDARMELSAQVSVVRSACAVRPRAGASSPRRAGGGRTGWASRRAGGQRGAGRRQVRPRAGPCLCPAAGAGRSGGARAAYRRRRVRVAATVRCVAPTAAFRGELLASGSTRVAIWSRLRRCCPWGRAGSISCRRRSASCAATLAELGAAEVILDANPRTPRPATPPSGVTSMPTRSGVPRPGGRSTRRARRAARSTLPARAALRPAGRRR